MSKWKNGTDGMERRNSMRKIKMICIDLDGTLLMNDHHTIPPRNLAAIRRAVQAGVEIVPATGRIFARVPQEVQQIAQLRYAIVINGAQVLDLEKKRPLYAAYLPVETVLRILERVAPLGLMPEIYQKDHMLITGEDLARLRTTAVERDHLEHLLCREQPVEDLVRFVREHPEGICKVNLPFFADPDLRAQLRREFESWGGLQCSTSMGSNLEINASGATKGRAVGALCGALGLSRDEVMAIGDSDNDIDLLRAVGCPVAMGNASAQVKALARMQTTTNEEAGVALAIEAALRGEIA